MSAKLRRDRKIRPVERVCAAGQARKLPPCTGGAAPSSQAPAFHRLDAVGTRRIQVSSPDAGKYTDGSYPATILVAEDHLDSRDALRALLEAFGYEVVCAVNGREAVELALAHRPDLILMDIMMPELDGFEATRALRRHERLNGTPIIAVTAMEGAHQLAIQAGANDCLRKPIDIRRLLMKVRNWLEQRDRN